MATRRYRLLEGLAPAPVVRPVWVGGTWGGQMGVGGGGGLGKLLRTFAPEIELN